VRAGTRTSYAGGGPVSMPVDVAAAFVYGSSLFRPAARCGDVDVVAVVGGSAAPWHERTVRPGRPPLSVTVAGAAAVTADLDTLAYAGFLLNKLVNPILPVAGAALLAAWQRQALAAVGAVAVCPWCWKDEQFPGWRRTHPAVPPTAVRAGGRVLTDLRRTPQERGHWDVYRSLSPWQARS